MNDSDRRSWAAVLVFLVVSTAIAVGLFVVTDTAQAAVTYSTDCPEPPEDVDPEGLADDAIETRRQRIADAAICEALAERIARIAARVGDLEEAVDESTEEATTAQRVALSPRDRQAATLSWYGAWAAVGLLLVLIIAQRWYGSWRVLRD